MQSQINVHLPAVDIVEGGLFGTLGLPRHVYPDERSHAKALEAMEMLGVAKLADQDIMTMSSGQARRVLFARALVHDPSTLLLDEPCSALDVRATQTVEELLLRLKERYTVVIVTHNLAQARRIADRTMFLYNGQLIEQGEHLLTHPQEKETRAFLEGAFG